MINLKDLAIQGCEFTGAQAATLEADLGLNQENTHARMQLVGFYFMNWPDSHEYRKNRARHILWLIERLPTDPLLMDPMLIVVCEDDSQGYNAVKTLWKKQIQIYPDCVQVMLNAAAALFRSDFTEAQSIFEHAEQLEPTNPRVILLKERMRNRLRLL